MQPPSSPRHLRIKPHGDVYNFVFFIHAFVQSDIPFPGRKKILRLLPELRRIAGIVRVPTTNLPSVNHTRSGMAVEPLNLQLTHLVDVPFANFQAISYGSFTIIHFGYRADGRLH